MAGKLFHTAHPHKLTDIRLTLLTQIVIFWEKIEARWAASTGPAFGYEWVVQLDSQRKLSDTIGVSKKFVWYNWMLKEMYVVHMDLLRQFYGTIGCSQKCVWYS